MSSMVATFTEEQMDSFLDFASQLAKAVQACEEAEVHPKRVGRFGSATSRLRTKELEGEAEEAISLLVRGYHRAIGLGVPEDALKEQLEGLTKALHEKILSRVSAEEGVPKAA